MSKGTLSVWSWVGQPAACRPLPKGVGGYKRPLSQRDQIIAKAFGAEVRRLRLAAKLSTRQLAELISLSQPMIIYIEKCRVNIELRLMWDFAEAFGVEATHFTSVCDRAVTLAAVKKVHKERKTSRIFRDT